MRKEWSDSIRSGQRLQERTFGTATAAKLALACLAICGTSVYAQPYKGSWEPTSTTALSITGKVTIDSQRITFAGAGKPLTLDTKIVEARAGRWLFAVTGSKTGPIPLIRKNSLCAPGQLPTYVVVEVSRGNLMVGLSSAAQAPSLEWTDFVPSVDCGVYFYSR